MKEIVKLENVVLHYDSSVFLDNLNMEFEEGKFYSVIGPSGCGKTTILNLIAGFRDLQEGNIIIDNEVVNRIPAQKRKVNTVFQDYALFEHLNVFGNVAFGLKIKKMSKVEIKNKVTEILKLVKLEGFENRGVNELSGGQKQRVAIARSLVMEPKVLLLDEPLSALDFELRQEMQYFLKDIQQKLGITFIFVTHDQEEALFLSDYIYVLQNGSIMQKGTPKDIYDEPQNLFVARFIGQSNIFKGTIINQKIVEFAHGKFTLEDKGFENGEAVNVIIRPEDVLFTKDGIIKATIETKVFKGSFFEYKVADENGNIWTVHTSDEKNEKSKVSMTIKENGVHVIK